MKTIIVYHVDNPRERLRKSDEMKATFAVVRDGYVLATGSVVNNGGEIYGSLLRRGRETVSYGKKSLDMHQVWMRNIVVELSAKDLVHAEFPVLMCDIECVCI